MLCKNCECTLEMSNKFCSNCGGKVIQNRITVKQILLDFSERYLSFDNKFLLTFKTLFTNPSDVVNGYINGLRVKYVNPVSYFLIAVFVGGIYSYLMVKGYLGKLDYTAFEDSKAPFKMEEMMSKISEYNNLIYLSFMPFLALMSKIVFYDKKEYNFAEHFVIYAYTYSQCAIITFLFIPIVYLIQPNNTYLSAFSMILYVGLHAYFLKQIFSYSTKQILFKTLFFLPIFAVLYVVLTIIFALIFFIYLIASGDFQNYFPQ